LDTRLCLSYGLHAALLTQHRQELSSLAWALAKSSTAAAAADSDESVRAQRDGAPSASAARGGAAAAARASLRWVVEEASRRGLSGFKVTRTPPTSWEPLCTRTTLARFSISAAYCLHPPPCVDQPLSLHLLG
jgi:hypothetical protein